MGVKTWRLNTHLVARPMLSHVRGGQTYYGMAAAAMSVRGFYHRRGIRGMPTTPTSLYASGLLRRKSLGTRLLRDPFPSFQ